MRWSHPTDDSRVGVPSSLTWEGLVRSRPRGSREIGTIALTRPTTSTTDTHVAPSGWWPKSRNLPGLK